MGNRLSFSVTETELARQKSVEDMNLTGHLPLANTPLANCKVFGFWMRVLMGVCLQNSLIALRSYGLYRVFGLIGGIVHWHIRGIKSSFDESREMMIAYVIVIAAVTLSTALTYSTPLYHLNVRLRIIYTSLNHIAGNSLWWVIMAKPLYKCLFDRERYLKQWIGKLRDDGLQKEYNVDSNEATAVVHGFSSSYIKRSTLLASTNGNKKGGDFHPMEDSIYSDGYDSRDRTNTIYFQHSESPLTFDGGISNDLGNCFPSAAGQYNGDVMLEVATQSLDSEGA
ncbi:hypothetical protein GGF37_001945, partial [Kickxella alabastrina]